MVNLRYDVSHTPVAIRCLARKAVEEIPSAVDGKLVTPFEKLNILQWRDAFLHQIQQFSIETFDAWLDPPHSGIGQDHEFVAAHVGFDLPEKQPVSPESSDFRKEG